MMTNNTKAFQQIACLGSRHFARCPPSLATFPSTKLVPGIAHRQSLSMATVMTQPATSSNKNLALGVLGGLTIAGLHSATGSQNDFYDYRFQTNKPTNELASFYGGEELMELFCVFPFVGQLMMRNGTFDDEGNISTMGIPGSLKVSMVFSEDEDSKDLETGELGWFNKRERFRNTLFGWTCWDMVMNFGFRTLDDGRIEVYHYGEYFHGNLPVVSQVVKLVFKTHARWLAWSTEHHINHFAFAETEEEEEFEEESRKNMPLFLLSHYAWSDLTAMLFGTKEDVDTSFLILQKENLEDRAKADEKKLENLLPIQREAMKIQISQDIADDRITTRRILARNPTHSAESLLTRRYTLSAGGQKGNTYAVATEAARLRQLTRAATRRDSFRVVEEVTDDSLKMEPVDFATKNITNGEHISTVVH